ncbi:hypothetical protein THAOC_25457 [Thalassiosira oceanica]|uniref:Uncharacterized protein n=1 Tax=Thalassiosira oceanica TaxID=159749 RepID=K0S7S5_THAOC|nr:hypothetical protein THAOC_25457 [Thalassiosira oceanica]|eukprot:EJK54877.1 hypothetical protein THAOC_25457 [Thalassiosira oceanica]
MFAEDRVAHPWNAHVFAVPQLMTHLWRHSLGKDADLSFTVTTGNHFWARAQHESLLIAVVLPLCHSPAHRGPWVLRGSEGAVDLARELERGFRLHSGRLSREQLSNMDPSVQEMWKDPERRSRTLLLQFLSSARKFPPVQECLVRGLLRGKFGGPVPQAPGSRARRRRPGRGRKRPAPRNKGSHEEHDASQPGGVRSERLDALWAREPGTVQGNLSRAVRDHREAAAVCSLERGELPYLPSPELKDRVGMTSAVYVLQASRRAGQYVRNVQYETVRKSATWIGNMYEAGAAYTGAPTTDAPPTAEPFESASPTRRKWFARFLRGVKLRMGQVRYQNEPLTSEMVLALDQLITAEWLRTTDERERERLEELMCYVLIGQGGGATYHDHALRPFQGGNGLQVALPSHQRSVRQPNPFQEVDRVPVAPAVSRSGPPGGLAVRQEGREDQGADQGLRRGLRPLHGGSAGEPAGAVLGRHVDGALFPSSLDAPRGGPDDDGQGSEHDRQHDQPVADEGGRERLRARPLDGANLHEHEGLMRPMPRRRDGRRTDRTDEAIAVQFDFKKDL